MRRTWMLAAAVLTLSCATAQISGGVESPVRLDTQAAVGWEPQGPFMLDLTIYNATGHKITVVTPTKEALEVKVFREPDGRLMCKTPSAAHKAEEGWATRDVRAASGLRLQVDVWPYCRTLPEGVYRYQAIYVANHISATTSIFFSGTIGPQGGRIVVAPGVSTDEAALAAALAAPPPAPREAAAAEAPTAAPADQPAAAPAPAAEARPAAPVNPEAIRACVDRELAARGLNAYGDPQGTRYEDRPPVDEGGRVLYVASRSPEIRVACRIPGF